MNITELKEKLQAAIADSSLPISALAEEGSNPISIVTEKLSQLLSGTLSGVSLDVDTDNKQLTLSADCSIGSDFSFSWKTIFTQTDNGLSAQIEFSKSDAIELGGFSWLTLTDTSVTLLTSAADDNNRAYTGTLNTTLNVKDVATTLSANVSNTDGTLLTASVTALSLSPAEDFSALAGLLPDLLTETELRLSTIDLKIAAEVSSLESIEYLKLGVTAATEKAIVDDVLTISDITADVEIKQPFTKARAITGTIAANGELFGASVTANAAIEKEIEIAVSAEDLNLSAIAEKALQGVSLPTDLPDIRFDELSFTAKPSTKEFSLTASTMDDWEIDISDGGIEVEDLTLQLDRTKTDQNTYETTGSLTGALKLGDVQAEAKFSFPGDLKIEASVKSLNLSPLVQDLCGAVSMTGTSLPPALNNLTLSELTITGDLTNKSFGISAISSLGAIELLVKKNTTGKWGFVAAIAPPESFKFSGISDSLKSLDGLQFENTALVLSSAPDNDPQLSIVDVPQSVKLVKGLVFFSTLNTSGLGVDDLMDMKSIAVSAALSTNVNDIKVQAALDGSFKISDSVSMGNMAFFIKPAPTNFALGVSGTVWAKLGSSDLEFIGTMAIKPLERSASFAATMLGEWKEPFGINSLAVSDVALEVGIGIVPPPAVVAPIVGVAGGISIGSFMGNAAVKFDTANPSKSMLAASFNELKLNEVIQSLCTPEVYNGIPKEIQQSVLSAGMEDVGVYVVPQSTTIGELSYEAGFRFEGKISVAGFDAEFFFLLDYSSGLAIKASMDPINIGGLVKVEGAGGVHRPTLDIDLRVGGDPGILIAGAIEILGVRQETYVRITDNSFEFEVSGKIFDLFETQLQVKGANLKEGGDFYVKAYMRNDLIAYLREKALEAIEDAANEATRKIEDAQDDIDDAKDKVNSLQREINSTRKKIRRERERDTKKVREAEETVALADENLDSLNNQIGKARETVKKERERDAKAVKNAQSEVDKAQATVNKLSKDISSMRKKVQAERDRDTQNLRNAQNKVSAAQHEVNKLSGEISSSKKRIGQLNDDISSKKRWFKKSKWYQKSYRWAEYSAYAAAKGAEITALYAKIGALEAAKATANGVLEAAKQVVRGIEKGIDSFPIDADPRIAALFTAKETASLALKAAKGVLSAAKAVIKGFPIDADPRVASLIVGKETAELALDAAQLALKGVQGLIKNFPIDADPRIMALFTAKETANAALEVAEQFLEGVKQSVGALADVASAIATYGLGGLFDIKEASFEGQLSGMESGSVMLYLKFVFMKKESEIEFAFNFNNPLAGAKALAGKLLAEL